MFLWKLSQRRKTYKFIKNLEYFHVQHKLFAMSDKRNCIKNPYPGKKRKTRNKSIKPFPNNEHKYANGWYCNECYDNDLDLVTSSNWKLSHIRTLCHMECLLQKKKKTSWYLKKNYQLLLMLSLLFASSAVILIQVD